MGGLLDSLCRPYDAVRRLAADFWNWTEVEAQITRHLGKPDFAVVNVKGLKIAQIAKVKTHVDGLNAVDQLKIRSIGS